MKDRMMLIFLDETDTWGHGRVPLYEAIVEALFDAGISGATAHTGIMGFGSNRHLHRKGLFGITDEHPVTITVVEKEAKLRAILPRIKAMVPEGIIFLVEGEVVHLGLREVNASDSEPHE
jgi:PII-like signaling protein